MRPTSSGIATCSTIGRTGCYAGVGWTGVESTSLTEANIRNGALVGGVMGGYPSATNRLAGADTTTDLTSLAAGTAAGSYEFFDSAGSRYTGAITDAGTITVGTSSQTFNTSLYRQFTVPGDVDLVAANIASGINILGVSGSASLRPANCAADGGTNCVAVAGFPAADTSGLASKVLSTASVAGDRALSSGLRKVILGSLPSGGGLPLFGRTLKAKLESRTADSPSAHLMRRLAR